MSASDNLAPRSTDNLSRAIKISLGIHIAFLVLLYVKSIVMPGPLNTKEYIPSLRVDLVALPDQKINDQLTPSTPAVSEPAKEKESKVTKEAKDKGDYSTSKKKKKERMKSALERIKALEKIKAGEEIRGNKVMKGSSAKGVASDSVETTYFDAVLEKVQNEWELPQWLQEKNLSAKVLIQIDRRGMVTHTQFVQSSGNEQFDAAVKHAIQAAAPFPVPPVSILAGVSQDGVLLKFPL